MQDEEAGHKAPDSSGKDDAKAPSMSPLILGACCCALVAFGAADRIAFKLMADAMPHYVYFLHQLTMVVYVVAFFTPVILGGELFAINRSLLGKFAVMGGIDCMCTLIVICAAPHVAGPLQILLMQGVLPATLLATRVVFGRKYLWVHYLGAAIIVSGIVFAVADPAANSGHAAKSGDKPSSASSEPESRKDAVLWALFFFSFNIPAAISSVYKEHVFKTSTQEISINLLNAWVSVFQFFFGILWVPVVAPLENTAFKDIPSNFADGGVCLFQHESRRDGDYCTGYTTFVVFLCLACNVGWNVFILLIIKHATASLMFVANTLTIPLANLGFSIPFVVSGGPTPRSRITWEGLAALVVTLLGLCVYQSKDEPDDAPQHAPPPPPPDNINSPLLPPRHPAASPGSINGTPPAASAPRSIATAPFPINGSAASSHMYIASPRAPPTAAASASLSRTTSFMARSFSTRFGGASFTGIRQSTTPTATPSAAAIPTGATPGSPGDAVWRASRTYSNF